MVRQWTPLPYETAKVFAVHMGPKLAIVAATSLPMHQHLKLATSLHTRWMGTEYFRCFAEKADLDMPNVGLLFRDYQRQSCIDLHCPHHYEFRRKGRRVVTTPSQAIIWAFQDGVPEIRAGNGDVILSVAPDELDGGRYRHPYSMLQDIWQYMDQDENADHCRVVEMKL